MEFISNNSSLTLSEAILLYKGSGGEVEYASVHRICTESGKQPVIKAGRPVSVDAVRSTVKDLSKRVGVDLLQWCDESIIATSPDLLCWWTPAQKRWMHFNVGKFVASGQAKQPALVWILFRRSLYVFALRENAKPGPETELFDSPYLNVWAEGKVCTGSMPVDGKTSKEGWVEAFYASTFTHANPSERKLTSYRLGNNALWKACLAKPDRAFPVCYLKPNANKTLGLLLKRLVN